jgi:methyl-accepting chemotaxis protein
LNRKRKGFTIIVIMVSLSATVTMVAVHLFTTDILNLSGSILVLLASAAAITAAYTRSKKHLLQDQADIQKRNRQHEEQVTWLQEEIDRLLRKKDNSIPCSDCRVVLEKIFLHYRHYMNIQHHFIQSIIKNLSDASKPLSEEILNIKGRVQEFMHKLKVWDDVLNSDTSSRNFSTTIDQYTIQNRKFETVSSTIEDNYQELENQLQTIVGMIDRIMESSTEISDISEKIKVLSINASIESSRAGHYGQGFKVIAGEIKRLSENTQSCITAINDTVSTARRNASGTLVKFRGDCKSISGLIDDQKKNIGEFYEKLVWYQEYFETVFATVSELAGKTSGHIDSFSPVFQKHDIAFQELENVERMCRSFKEQYHGEDESENMRTDSSDEIRALEDLINIVKDNITTDSEIELVNKLAEQYGIETRLEIGSSTDVEFF